MLELRERETRECRAHMAEEAKKEKPLRKPAQTHQQAPAVPQNGNAQGGDISHALVVVMERLEHLKQGGGYP